MYQRGGAGLELDHLRVSNIHRASFLVRFLGIVPDKTLEISFRLQHIADSFNMRH